MLPLINGTRTKTQCLVLDQVRKLVVNKELNIQLGSILDKILIALFVVSSMYGNVYIFIDGLTQLLLPRTQELRYM